MVLAVIQQNQFLLVFICILSCGGLTNYGKLHTGLIFWYRRELVASGNTYEKLRHEICGQKG
jgi:hypothetical protein